MQDWVIDVQIRLARAETGAPFGDTVALEHLQRRFATLLEAAQFLAGVKGVAQVAE